MDSVTSKYRHKPTQHVIIKWSLVVGLLLMVWLGWWLFGRTEPILVGVVHSQTGTMAEAEKGVLQATLAAIEQVNRLGGVKGRPVEAVVIDGASDAQQFAAAAKQLLTEHSITTIFGGWTSSSRRMMKPVIEHYQGLLFYPLQYEGVEFSPNIIYTGSVPNQQLFPALMWMLSHVGKRVFLLGSDYIFPRIENSIAYQLLANLGAQVCDDFYIPLGSGNTQGLAEAIAHCQPDFIINSVNGNDNLAVFSALRQPNAQIPILSLSLDEYQLHQLIVSLGAGVTQEHYIAATYFSSLELPENAQFQQQVMQLVDYPLDVRYISAAMKSAWDGVLLWAQAANLSADLSTEQLIHTLDGMSLATATGPVGVHWFNHHLWQPVYVGKAQPNGQIKVLWQSEAPIEPEPWPLNISTQAWQALVDGWYRSWGMRWQAP